MKKIFFSDEENLSEKAFMQGIATCVFSIILCLIALCSVTWAWFSTDLSSASNTIQTGTYRLNIELTGDESMPSIIASQESQTSCTYDLTAGTYQIQLAVESNSVKKGYCKITIGKTDFYTEAILLNDEPFSITLTMKESSSVTFEWHWGIYSGEPDVYNGETLEINYNISES